MSVIHQITWRLKSLPNAVMQMQGGVYLEQLQGDEWVTIQTFAFVPLQLYRVEVPDLNSSYRLRIDYVNFGRRTLEYSEIVGGNQLTKMRKIAPIGDTIQFSIDVTQLGYAVDRIVWSVVVAQGSETVDNILNMSSAETNVYRYGYIDSVGSDYTKLEFGNKLFLSNLNRLNSTTIGN